MATIYTYDIFVYKILDHTSRVADRSKLLTLGPFACAFAWMIGDASKNRKDLNPMTFAKCQLFRGTGMKEEDIEQYR